MEAINHNIEIAISFAKNVHPLSKSWKERLVVIKISVILPIF